MLLDDRPEWPMAFFFRLQFSQPLDTGRLARAMLATSVQHPLLSARVFYGPRHRPYWIPSEPMGEVRTFHPVGSINCPPCMIRFDLSSEPAWRIWKSSRESDSSIWIEFHHAVCDGLGALRTIDDLLMHYAEDAPAPLTSFAYNWEQAAERGRFRQLPRWRDRLGQWVWMAWRTALYMATTPASLEILTSRQPDDCQTTSSPQAAFENSACTLGSIHALRQAAHRHNCTITDLVIHELFGAFGDLFAMRRPLEHLRLRVFVPMDLRGNPRNECRVCNVLGMFHLDRVVGPASLRLKVSVHAGGANETMSPIPGRQGFRHLSGGCHKSFGIAASTGFSDPVRCDDCIFQSK